MTETVARRALAAWGMEGATFSLIARRENTVFRVRAGGADYALRLHRPGYRSTRAIDSELAWMRHLHAEGLAVPEPVLAESGALTVEAQGYRADLLTWLDGVPMGTSGTPLSLPDRTGTFRTMGRTMARLHRLSDEWTLPDGFERHRWDVDGLLGETPLWGRFWDNPGASGDERARLRAARDRLRDDLCGATDFGLIHADMVRENVLIDGPRLGLIDFDDGGFGYRLFDVATALFKNRTEPGYDALEAAFLAGYRTVRPLDTTLLMAFMAVRAVSYLGWIVPRMDEPGADARQKRFLASAMPLVDARLAGDGFNPARRGRS